MTQDQRLDYHRSGAKKLRRSGRIVARDGAISPVKEDSALWRETGPEGLTGRA